MTDDTADENKFWALVHPGAPGGVVREKPEMRQQDAEAEPVEMYAVVFFPKITGIGPAALNFYGLQGTLSNSPEAARVRFMDRMAAGQKWETFSEAGHRIRKVRVTDLGDA